MNFRRLWDTKDELLPFAARSVSEQTYLICCSKFRDVLDQVKPIVTFSVRFSSACYLVLCVFEIYMHDLKIVHGLVVLPPHLESQLAKDLFTGLVVCIEITCPSFKARYICRRN